MESLMVPQWGVCFGYKESMPLGCKAVTVFAAERQHTSDLRQLVIRKLLRNIEQLDGVYTFELVDDHLVRR